MVKPVNPQHIAVACEDNIINLLLALPLFQTLREQFPQAKITALMPVQAQGFIQRHPSIDHVEIIPAGEGPFQSAKRFKRLETDAFISLYPASSLVLAAWLAKIPIRIGMEHKWHNFFLTHPVRVNRAVSDRNEVEYNFELLKPLGITQFSRKIEFPLSEADKAGAQKILSEKGIAPGTPYVLVHPGSRGQARHWKAEKYGQLLGHLCQIKGLRVVLTGEPDQSAVIAQVAAFLFSLPSDQKPVPINTGELVLGELAGICEGALCVLSGPLGPMHLAAAVGTPTVTIFSPAPEATPVRWGAWGNENVALVPNNPLCNACQVGYCKKHDPMEALTVPEVFEAMKPFIARKISV
jgi:ADP-heptose:LPS heptosyltransferase